MMAFLGHPSGAGHYTRQWESKGEYGLCPHGAAGQGWAVDQGAHAHSTERPTLTREAGLGAVSVQRHRGFLEVAPSVLSLWKVL